MKKIVLFLFLIPILAGSQQWIKYPIKPYYQDSIKVKKGIISEKGIKIGNATNGTAGTIDFEGTKFWTHSSDIDSIWINKWADNGTTGEIYYSGGNIGIGLSNPDAALDIYQGSIKMNDGNSNGYLKLLKVRAFDYMRIMGSALNGWSLIMGGLALHNYCGPDSTASFAYSNVIGGQNASNLYLAEQLTTFGSANLTGHASVHKLNLKNTTVMGYHNMYNLEDSEATADTINFEDIYMYGNINGASLWDSSENVILIGTGLLDIEDLGYNYELPYKNLTIIGCRPNEIGTNSLLMEGTMVINYNEDSATSYVNFNVDELQIGGVPFSGGGGNWADSDDTTYTSNNVVIGGTNPETPTTEFSLYGDMYIAGQITGPYVNSPAIENVFFGESIELTDSTAIWATLSTNMTDIGIGKLLYTTTSFNLDTCENNRTGNQRVQYMSLSGVSGGKVDVLLPGSFVKNTSWSWSVGYIYLSTAGGMTQTAPTASGVWVTEVGWAVSATTMFFNPTITIQNP